MFIGSFLSFNTSFDTTPISAESTEQIILENGVYDEIYLDSNEDLEYTTAIPDWGHTTVLDAKFNDNILAGNVNFTISSISGMIVKKRRIGDYKWTTIYKTDIHSEEDLSFYYNDFIVASRTRYEYAAIPILNGAEGTYQTIQVDVDFNGAFIIDQEKTYNVLLDVRSDSLTRPVYANIVEPVNSKYPYVHYYSKAQYDKFNLTGAFIELKKELGYWDVENGSHYRKEFRDFIGNKRSKIVKFDDGRIYMACVIDSINESRQGHDDLIHTTLQCIEVGDVYDNADLYYHGFVDFLEVGV